MKPRWDSLTRGSQIREQIQGLTALFCRRFFRDCPVPLRVSSGRIETKIDCCNLLFFWGRFYLRVGTVKQADSTETVPSVLQAGWLACCPTLLMSPDLGLREKNLHWMNLFSLFKIYIIILKRIYRWCPHWNKNWNHLKWQLIDVFYFLKWKNSSSDN